MSSRLRFTDLHPIEADMRAEVIAGLSKPRKQLPPKYLYDRRGSQLFDAITQLPEYYPTRTEIGILADHGGEMADLIGRGGLLVELGSGSSYKIRVLLQALRPSVYVPVDISRDHLRESATALAQGFNSLSIHAVCADYSSPFALPIDEDDARKTAFFPGSSIGNFDPHEARRFLELVGNLIGQGGRLLIGVDLIKDVTQLDAAYNDSQGITAEFNLNLLRRLNRDLHANFDLERFRHAAFYNAAASRIEMHLISVEHQRVQLGGQRFSFRSGESIHTESSYKYSVGGFRSLARNAGFEAEQVWTDPDNLFSVHCLRFVQEGHAH